MLGALIAMNKVRTGFASMSKGDMDTFYSVFADDAEVIYPTKGSIKGKAAIFEFYSHFRKTFPEVAPVVLNLGVENLFDFVGTNVVSTHFKIATTNREGITYHQEGMQLIKVERGMIKLIHYFFYDTVALREAWTKSE